MLDSFDEVPETSTVENDERTSELLKTNWSPLSLEQDLPAVVGTPNNSTRSSKAYNNTGGSTPSMSFIPDSNLQPEAPCFTPRERAGVTPTHEIPRDGISDGSGGDEQKVSFPPFPAGRRLSFESFVPFPDPAFASPNENSISNSLG